jgi:hypothetical protein
LNLADRDYDTMFLFTVPNDEVSVEGFKYSCSSLDEKMLGDILDGYSDISIFMFSSRLVDILVHRKLRRNFGITRSCVMQHGIYVDKLNRTNLFSSIRALRVRILFYFKEILRTDLSNWLLCSALYYVYFKEIIYLRDHSLWSNLDTPKDVFCFNQNGEEHFKKYFGDKLRVYQGYNLDFDSLLDGSIECEKDEVIYVAQTLVEDGRHSRNGFVSLLSEIHNVVSQCGYRLSVKLHPRSDLTLYDKISIYRFYREWPKSFRYIGHYSAVNELIAPSGGLLFIYDQIEHKVPREYFVYGDDMGGAERLSYWLQKPTIKKLLPSSNQITYRELYRDKLELFVNDSL